jgi:signal transduction histidine kinase
MRQFLDARIWRDDPPQRLFKLMTDSNSHASRDGWLIRVQPFVLPVMLTLLFGALLQAPGSWLAKSLFVAHFGLFIIWQPFVEGGQRLSPLALAGLLLVLGGLTISLDAWTMMIWIMFLAGVVGGKVLLRGGRASSFRYLLALAFLVLALLLLATPAAFAEAKLPPTITAATFMGLPMLLFVMFALPGRQPRLPSSQGAEIVDFVNSAFVFLLLAVLVLGSLAAMLLFKYDYAIALINTLLVLGAVLLVLGWVWNPHRGFSGLGEFFSRYLMSIGLPAEQWMQVLADHAVQDEDPDRFIERALVDMAERLPWLRAIEWTTPSHTHCQGDKRGRKSTFTHRELRVALYTSYSLSPSLTWHFQLLVQLLGEFHADKLRAIQLKQLSYLQAVHETGARLTHDVKNLLQSLQTLCHAAEEPEAENSPEFRALLRRQLPALASRLGVTLSKLQVTQDEPRAELQNAAIWWSEVARRYADTAWVHLDADLAENAITIPVAVFSSVLENLLANAEEKRARERTLHVRVSMQADTHSARLSVCDDGSPVSADIAHRLMVSPVPPAAANGLGIGLFQVARLATSSGYALSLDKNQPGTVCFVLAGALPLKR